MEDTLESLWDGVENRKLKRKRIGYVIYSCQYGTVQTTDEKTSFHESWAYDESGISEHGTVLDYWPKDIMVHATKKEAEAEIHRLLKKVEHFSDDEFSDFEVFKISYVEISGYMLENEDEV